jgi:hypothetical protein
VSGVSGITEEGDNFRWNGSILAGGNLFGDRLNLTFAYSHDEVDGVLSNSRGFLRDNVGGVSNISLAEATARRVPGVGTNDGRVNPNIPLNETTTDLIPPGILARNVRIPFLTRGGLISGTNLAATDPGTLLQSSTTRPAAAFPPPMPCNSTGTENWFRSTKAFCSVERRMPAVMALRSATLRRSPAIWFATVPSAS